jgi:2-isopropylmalate synthase
VSDEEQANDKEAYRFVSLAQHSETGESPKAKVVFAFAGKEVTVKQKETALWTRL